MHDIPFHIYAMKEPDYVMKLMSTYGTNELQADHSTKRIYKDSEKKTILLTFIIPKLCLITLYFGMLWVTTMLRDMLQLV